MHKHLIHKRPSRLLFLMCWIAYGSSYIGRINFSAALTMMVRDGGIPKQEAGLIGTAFFFCYGFGQLLSGLLGDRISPFKMVFTGLVGASIANLSMCLSSHTGLMMVMWGLNGLFQSMLWSPVLYILSAVLCEDMRKQACLRIATCVPAGTISAYLLSMLVLNYLNWKLLFAAAALVLFTVLVVWTAAWAKIRKHLVPDFEKPVKIAGGNHSGGRAVRLLPMLVTSGVLVTLLPAMLHGMIKEGVNIWVPTMLNELYSIGAVFSLFLSMFLPLISIIGPYIITFLYFKVLHRNEIMAAALSFLSALPSLTALLLIDRMPVVVSVALLACVVTSMYAVNHTLVVLIPVRFAPFRKTASVTGLANSITYLGCAAASYGFGWIAQRWGWNAVIVCCISIALFSVLICFMIMPRWNRFKTDL